MKQSQPGKLHNMNNSTITTEEREHKLIELLIHGYDESDEAVLELTGRCTTCGHPLTRCKCGQTPSTNATTKSANV